MSRSVLRAALLRLGPAGASGQSLGALSRALPPSAASVQAAVTAGSGTAAASASAPPWPAGSQNRGFAAPAASEAAAQRSHPGRTAASWRRVEQPPPPPPNSGRVCRFQHQFSLVGQVEGEYEITPAAKFAVIEVGPHQFKVTPGDVIMTEKINGVDVMDKLEITSVMMLGSTAESIIGRPTVPGANVVAAVEEQFLDAKKLIYKKRRRKDSKRLKGHRQPLTTLRILEVNGIEEAQS